MNATIREATAADIPRLSELLRQILVLHHAGRPDLFHAAAEKYTPGDIAEMLNDSARHILAAADGNDRLIGYAFCEIRRISANAVRSDRTLLYLDDLCVDKNFRGHGIGRQLLNAVKDYAVSIAADAVELNVWETNRTAIDFYKNLGFFTQRRTMELPLTSVSADIDARCAEYLALPFVFNGFADTSALTDGETELVCIAKHDAEPQKNFVPDYLFDIRKNGLRIGELRFRVGYSEQLFYSGNIGYEIDPAYRGHSYAETACRLLIPLIQAHGMRAVGITNEINNAASRRTCEKLGARLICLAPVPKWHDTYYSEGMRFMNIFLWDI